MSYSLDLRKKAMEKLAAGQSIRKTAQDLGIHFTTVQEWKKRKDLAPTKRTTSNNKKIDDVALLEDVRLYPDAYQYERAKRLGCSTSGIFFALRRLGITYKKNT